MKTHHPIPPIKLIENGELRGHFSLYQEGLEWTEKDRENDPIFIKWPLLADWLEQQRK